MNNDALIKSMDALLDEFFAKAEMVPGQPANKTHVPGPETMIPHADKTADEGLEGVEAEEGEEDEKAGKKRGRPEDLSQMAMRDMKTGESKGKYDASIAHEDAAPADDARTTPGETGLKMKKSFEVSEEDYEILMKAKTEALEKAKKEELDLFKAHVAEAIKEATAPLVRENELLKKSLQKQESLLKSVASMPAPRKSIPNVAYLEKSYDASPETFTKADVSEAIDALVKSEKLTVQDGIEYDFTGMLEDPAKRAIVERYLAVKK